MSLGTGTYDSPNPRAGCGWVSGANPYLPLLPGSQSAQNSDEAGGQESVQSSDGPEFSRNG